jgi:acylphosphatase
MSTARLFTIRGRVQGVFFRASTRRVAESLGITGYAINLPDGSVEVLACGPESQVDRLGDWLEQGPEMARVDGVKAETIDVDPPSDFQTG